MNELKFIPLKDITMLSNYRDVEPVSEKDPEIIELSKSIGKHGVMQPILVRPNGKENKFELIFGHRRMVAAKLAKLDVIPSNVKTVADEEILEYQVTENLQRKDVHPMDEAVAFKSMIDKMKLTSDEIAARFAKSVDYIVQRLKLNDLISDLQKDFKKKIFGMGHALQFCRLSPDDQKRAKKDHCYGNDRYGTVGQLSNFIDNNIIRNLSSAPFKKDDTELVPAAGACKVCPKRCGANKSLFPDVDKDDRCFDSKCFELKLATHMAAKAREIIETQPGIHLVCKDASEIPAVIKAMAKETDVRILEDDKDFRTWNYGEWNKKAKGYYVQGWNAGKEEAIYLKGSGKGAGSSTAAKEKEKSGKLNVADIDEEIKRINDREKRSKEIDLNKIHKDILEQLDKKKKNALALPHQSIDRGIMIFILLQESTGFAVHDKFKLPGAHIGYSKKGYAEDYFKQLSKINDDDLAKLIREIAWSKWMNKNFASDVNTSDTGLRLIAQYAGIDIKTIEKAQAEISTKRNERIANRISDLREKKKELDTKKSKAKKK